MFKNIQRLPTVRAEPTQRTLLFSIKKKSVHVLRATVNGDKIN
jgi:hypothetical protein